MRRRNALLAGGCLLTGAALTALGVLPRARDSELMAGSGGSGGQPLRDLPEFRSENGVLEYDLRVAPEHLRIGDLRVHVETYNGMLPGAVLRIRPGDTMRIDLHNHMVPIGVPLNAAPPVCAARPGENAGGATECLHAVGKVAEGETLVQVMTSTNLHTHGLQVSPEDPADNVFLKLGPGESHAYEYHVPDDHPAGLHWYHPHSHGSTSHQSWMGLSGPIVVEGDIDEVPEVATARERIMVINALWLSESDGEVPTAVVVPSAGEVPFSSIPAVPTRMVFPVNGQLQPDITIRPGETQRWRVLNAAPHRAMWLHVEEHPLHQIGQDGIPFGRTRRVPAIMLSSANRAEFIVRGGSPGRYRVFARAYDQGHPGGERATIELARLVVEGATADGVVPDRLVDPPRMPDQPVTRRRTLTFSGDISGHHGMGVRFYIDDQLFDHHRVDQEVRAGTVEEWRLVNEDVFQHPVHIHVNPFQVVDVKGIPAGDTSWQTDPEIWWDTVRLPPNGEVTIRTYFRPDITGKTVFHCHILPHEDNGMMGVLLITDGKHE
ncbi:MULTISPECIES: multicopper oxidase family protein [unclassified Nocardiopsis]|uniref:multicopper oxidase family protein n=1 Tax=unclassified Nocardiopsis TaxID=2649073 RepID=UPI001915AAED|nr:MULTISPECIES: multicopper oxidase domain-containing protein [unclassified Nocardiopsis]